MRLVQPHYIRRIFLAILGSCRDKQQSDYCNPVNMNWIHSRYPLVANQIQCIPSGHAVHIQQHNAWICSSTLNLHCIPTEYSVCIQMLYHRIYITLQVVVPCKTSAYAPEIQLKGGYAVYIQCISSKTPVGYTLIAQERVRRTDLTPNPAQNHWFQTEYSFLKPLDLKCISSSFYWFWTGFQTS